MKKLTPLAKVFCLLCMVGMTSVHAQNKGSVAAKSDARPIFPYPIQETTMDNGLKVVTVPYPSPGIASFYIVVRAGSRNEIEAGKTGFAHFFEHMMFRGTKNYSKEQYSAALKSTGASANANTSLDRTLYHMTGDASKLDLMFKLEADRFQNLSYSTQDFKTEAGAVKGEYTKNSANPYVKLNEKLQEAAFDKHTYKHTTMGFFEDVVDMPNQYDYSLEFFKRFYRPEYCTIIVVGDATQDSVNALAKKYFGEWKRGDYKQEIPVEPAQTQTKYAHLQQPGFPPLLSLNYKGPGYKDDMDFPALEILGDAFFGENSELYDRLVNQEQICRSLSADVYLTRDPFLISFEASLVKAEDMKKVREELNKTIASIKSKPISAEKLNVTKENFRNSTIMRLDNPTAIAEMLSYFTWVTGDPATINSYYAKYDKVTAEDLIRVAKKYLNPEGLTIATISPDESVKF